MNSQIDLGSVVVSIKGRDMGRVYLVSSILDKDFCMVVDGNARKFANPKKKRIKHLKDTAKTCDTIANKLKTQKKVFDAEVYSALKNIK